MIQGTEDKKQLVYIQRGKKKKGKQLQFGPARSGPI